MNVSGRSADSAGSSSNSGASGSFQTGIPNYQVQKLYIEFVHVQPNDRTNVLQLLLTCFNYIAEKIQEGYHENFLILFDLLLPFNVLISEILKNEEEVKMYKNLLSVLQADLQKGIIKL